MKKRNIVVFATILVGSVFTLEKTDPTIRQSRLAQKIIYENWDIAPQSANSEIYEEVESTSPEEIHIQLQLDYQEDFTPADNPTDDDSTHEEVKAYLAQLRAEGKNFHYTRNQAIYETLDFDEDIVQDIYISEYTPFIEMTISEEEFFEDGMSFIYDLVDNAYVACAYIGEIPELVSTGFEYPIYSTNFTATYESGLNCSDVIVGIYDPGIIKKNHVNIVGTNYLIRDELLYIETPTDHATQMASIIGGNSGLSKGCKILSAEAYGTPNAKMDWFINNGAEIINMSYGEKNATGIYSSESAYMDYVVQTYKILIVAAAGNFGETTGYVGNPGLGYNVLTAGASNYDESWSADFSSYAEVTGPNKPTLVVQGMGFMIPNFSGISVGTSYSSALVTAELVSLLQIYPALKTEPSRVIAMATANTRNMAVQIYKDATGMDNFVGGGYFDFGNIRQYASTGKYVLNTSPTIGQLYSCGYNIAIGEKFKIAMCVLAKSLKTVNGTTFTNYNIRARSYRSDTIIGQTSGTANLKIFEIEGTAENYGPIEIQFIQDGPCVVSGEAISMYIQRIPA